MWTNFCVKMVFDTFSRFSSISHPSQILKLQNWPFFMHNFLVLYLFIFLYYCFYIANLEISEVYLLCKWDSNTLLHKMCHVMLLWRHNLLVITSFFYFGYFSNLNVNITPKMLVFILEMCDKFASSFWSHCIALFMKSFYHTICSIHHSVQSWCNFLAWR